MFQLPQFQFGRFQSTGLQFCCLEFVGFHFDDRVMAVVHCDDNLEYAENQEQPSDNQHFPLILMFQIFGIEYHLLGLYIRADVLECGLESD